MSSPSRPDSVATTPPPALTRTPLTEAGAHILFWLIVVTLAGFATWANLDLTGHRAFLFMDEMIPFDNIKRILTASSPDALGWAVADGGDHRYGRIFYNLSALIAWAPFRLGGDTGLILALRSTQTVLLIGAMVLLCRTQLQTWSARAVALLAMACLPYTDYYLSQPKPEPVQLACYAIFIMFAARRAFAFGWHWLFLGLAFGAKISAAPLCALVGLLALIQLRINWAGWKSTVADGLVAGGSFIAGWIVAIPMLAVPTKTRIESYLNWTFRATGHGSDDSQVNALTWLKSLLGGEAVRWSYPPWVAVTLLGVAVCVLLPALADFWRRPTRWRDLFHSHSGWLLLGLAGSLSLPILATVKRLWGFYLFPGQILAIVALAAITERWLHSADLASGRHRLRRIMALGLVGVTLIACFFTGRHALREYRQLAHRTSDPKFLLNLAVFQPATAELDMLARDAAQQGTGVLNVLYDPYLFPPDSTPQLNVQPFWSATIYWEQNPAAILLGREWHLAYFLHEKPLPSPTSASYATLRAATAEFAARVETDPAAVSSKPYQLVRWFGTDAALVLRQDVAERWRKVSAPDNRARPPQ